MSGRIKRVLQIARYGKHDKILENPIKTGLRSTTLSNAQALKEVAHKNQVVGLAANEVGLDQRLFVVVKQEHLIPGQWTNYELSSPNDYEAIINPLEIESSNDQFCAFEQCPCFEGIQFKVWAPILINMSYYSEDDLKLKKNKKLFGFQGRVWDHQIRHLEGFLPIYHEICQGQFFLKNEYKNNCQAIEAFQLLKGHEALFHPETLQQMSQKKDSIKNFEPLKFKHPSPKPNRTKRKK